MSTDLSVTSNRFVAGGSVYTVSEVAETMRVSRMSVYRLIHAGTLPSLKVGSSFRVTQGALDLYLARASFVPADLVSGPTVGGEGSGGPDRLPLDPNDKVAG